MPLLDHQHFFLIGIKGVAMTGLAQCLIDAGKHVSGADTSESFVTQPILDHLNLKVHDFSAEIPSEIECVIYTAAHQGPLQQQVVAAKKRGLTVLSHAEALAELFNQQHGVAVCGVGGKSTVSAMLAWIFHQLHETDGTAYPAPSFAVGVGEILGMEKTGQWSPKAKVFIAEADDYVTDPSAPSRGEAITPRFSFLHPYVTVCTNLQFDHPDVYRDFAHTQEVFGQFFSQIQPKGTLVVNGDDQPLLELAKKIATTQQLTVHTFGEGSHNDWQLTQYHVENQHSVAQLKSPDQQTYQLSLPLPGKHNLLNAMAAVATAATLGVPPEVAVKHLLQFHSTKRRFEYVGKKEGVQYYDDYAHHPHEVAAAIKAMQEWYPDSRVVIAFQSHTFSRTKQLFEEFVTALSHAKEVVMIDIFASAREAFDPTVSSEMLSIAVAQHSPDVKVRNLHTIARLAQFCKTQLRPGDVCLTLGAGDIYQVHQTL